MQILVWDEGLLYIYMGVLKLVDPTGRFSFFVVQKWAHVTMLAGLGR